MIAVTQGLPNQTNQVIRFARFTSKNNIESGIFGIGVRLATHQDYRNIRSEELYVSQEVGNTRQELLQRKVPGTTNRDAHHGRNE